MLNELIIMKCLSVCVCLYVCVCMYVYTRLNFIVHDILLSLKKFNRFQPNQFQRVPLGGFSNV